MSPVAVVAERFAHSVLKPCKLMLTADAVPYVQAILFPFMHSIVKVRQPSETH